MPTEVEVLRMQRSKTEERLRRRDLRKIFVDPNACGVALPTVGFDSETATRGGFSAQDDTRGIAPPFYLFKHTDKSKFEAKMLIKTNFVGRREGRRETRVERGD